MALFLPLLLSHFLADYPLQWGWLVKYKKKHFLGVLLHCGIHLGVMLAIFYPLLSFKAIWIAIGGVFLTHNVIDQLKIKTEKARPTWRLALYLGDQALHIATVFLLSIYLFRSLPALAIKPYEQMMPVFLYVLILVASTYFYDITRYFLHSPHKNEPYRRDYKMMLRNAMIVTVGFGVYWLAG